jgi:hypothetical protein
MVETFPGKMDPSQQSDNSLVPAAQVAVPITESGQVERQAAAAVDLTTATPAAAADSPVSVIMAEAQGRQLLAAAAAVPVRSAETARGPLAARGVQVWLIQ